MNPEILRLYLDVCCLNRPFDDPTQERVRQEAEAVVLIMEGIYAGRWQWIGSDVVAEEIDEILDDTLKEQLETLLLAVNERVRIKPEIIERSLELESKGLKEYDALHLSCAEEGRTDLFLTTDDRLLRVAKRHQKQIRVKVENPLTWIQEVLKNDSD